MSVFAKVLGFYVLILFAVPISAHAYIDPALAGGIFQAVYIIAAGAVIFVVSPMMFFWKRIKRGVERVFRKRATVSVSANETAESNSDSEEEAPACKAG